MNRYSCFPFLWATWLNDDKPLDLRVFPSFSTLGPQSPHFGCGPSGCGCRCFHNDRCLLRCVCLTILGIPIRRIISFGRWLMTLVSKCPKWIITCIKLEDQLHNGSCTRDLSEFLATPYSNMFWGKTLVVKDVALLFVPMVGGSTLIVEVVPLQIHCSFVI